MEQAIHVKISLSRPLPAARWPIDDAALAALLDLGMSVDQLACYFSVDPWQVRSLCARYGLVDDEA